MRPMLACKIKFEQLDKLNYPLILQPKFDGVRALLHEDKVVSRTLKPIPNRSIQEALKDIALPLDGELIVGSPTNKLVCNDTVSFSMSEQKSVGLELEDKVDWFYYVFDMHYPQDATYVDRLDKLKCIFDNKTKYRIPDNVILVENYMTISPHDTVGIFDDLVFLGYEGCILRSLNSYYKYGRSTLKEQYLLKVKPYEDAEAIIIGFEPLEHNLNVKTVDERGYAKRSTHKANKLTDELLGALICETTEGVQFKVGTGFTQAQREQIWSSKEKYLDKLITYTYLNTGVKDKPRNPVFKCFRQD